MEHTWHESVIIRDDERALTTCSKNQYEHHPERVLSALEMNAVFFQDLQW